MVEKSQLIIHQVFLVLWSIGEVTCKNKNSNDNSSHNNNELSNR